MNTSPTGIALARRNANASLLVLPAAMALSAPAAAQSVISTNHYGPVNLAAYGAAGVSIASGVSIDSTGWVAMWDASPAQLNNAGQVQAANGTGILLGAGGSIANGGTISAGGYGVLVNNGAGQVSNSGVIAAGYDGVSLNRGGGVTNTGSIFGGHIGVYTGNGAGSVTNSGQISARTGDAVSLYSGGTLTNTASGRLLGGYSGVYAGGDGSRISNAGLISGPDFGVYLTGASSLSNSGTVAGGIDGVIDTGRGGVVENTGLMTGTNAGVKLAANGTLDNAGTIAGLTGVVANGAVDIIDTGSIIATGGGNAISLSRGASTITLGTGAQIVGDIAGNGTASSISLTGSGTLATDITGFSNGALSVAQGASWTGAGQWNVAQMINAGSFSAGLAAAPLRLNGNFVQTSTGTLVVLVEPGQVSSFTVTGTITLGGTLSYVLAPGTYTPASYQFLQADGGVNGGFSQVAGPAQPILVSVGTQAALLQVNGDFTVAPRGVGLLPDLSQAMTLDAEALGDMLLDRALAPGGGTGCQNAPATGSGKAGIASALAGGFCALGGWVEAAGTNLSTQDAYNFTGGGFLAGVDRAVPATGGRIGIAAGYDDATLRGQGVGDADLETIRLGLYASQPLGRVTLSAAVLDGIVSANTTRQTGAGGAVARQNGNVLSAEAQLAVPLRWGGADVAPAAGLRVTHVALGGFTETAAQGFALRAAGSSGTTVTPFLRMNLGRSFVTASRIVVTPRVSFGVDAALGNPGADMGLTTQDYTALTLNPRHLAPVSGEVGLWLSVARGNWSLDFGYAGRFAGNWSAQSLQAAISARF